MSTRRDDAFDDRTATEEEIKADRYAYKLDKMFRRIEPRENVDFFQMKVRFDGDHGAKQ